MITDVFLSLLEVSISTGFIILSVFLFSSRINKKYTMKWKYLIWLILAIRLMIPFNLNAFTWQYRFNIPDISIPNTTSNSLFKDGISFTLSLPVQKEQFNLLEMVSYIWFAGVIIIILIHVIGYWYYKITLLKECTLVVNKKYLEQVDLIAAQLKVNKNFKVMSNCNISSPMIIGLFHPVMVLPKRSYSEKESYFILKHELIHLKRNDIFYKLIMVLVQALHWYNPAVYLLKKEAFLDLELFCDEEVVKEADMASKKLYTEVLMSTLQKQLNRGSAISTQFNEGTVIMKKRFIQILNRREKKNGGVMCLGILLLTLLLGTLVSCTTKESSTSSVNNNDIQNAEQESESNIINEQDTQAENKINNNDSSTSKDDTLNDAQEIEEIVKGFSSAYFGKNAEVLPTYLSEAFGEEMEVYQGDTEAVSDITIKGLTDIQNKNIGDSCVVWIEFKQDSQADSYQYLTIELQKESTEWKIYFYGIEM